MTFRIHDSVDRTLDLAWQSLAGEVGTRFSSRPSYGLPWHRHVGRGPLRIATVHRGRQLVALLPLHERRRLGVRVFRLLGHGLGTVGEVLATDARAVDELVGGLAASGAVLELTHLPSGSPLVTATLAHGGWRSTFTEDDHCPVIALPHGTRAADLRSRSTLARAASTRRKLAREGSAMVIDTVRTTEELENRWPDIAATAGASDPGDGEARLNLCAPPYEAFTREFLRLEAERGTLLLWGATFGGTWGAHFATLTTGGTAELWFTRFDPLHRRCRPGHHLIEAACDQHDELGIDRIDLLLGRSAYKSDWQTDEYAVGTLLAVPAGARAAVARMRAADRAVGFLREGAQRGAETLDALRSAGARVRPVPERTP